MIVLKEVYVKLVVIKIKNASSQLGLWYFVVISILPFLDTG